MKNFTWLFYICLLCASPAFAEDNDSASNESTSSTENSNEYLAIIKPEQYQEIVAPIEESVHNTAEKLSKPEAMALINAKNRINKIKAHQKNELDPEPINIDPTDKVELEMLLYEPVYTYDDPNLANE